MPEPYLFRLIREYAGNPVDYQRGGRYFSSASKIAILLAAGYLPKAIELIRKNNLLATNTMAYPKKRSTMGRRTSVKKSSKGRRTRKPRRRVARSSKGSLAKQVRQIKKQLNADSARHVYKILGHANVTCAVNQVNNIVFDQVTGSSIETYMSQLRYYDPANPGTLVTAAGGTGTYQREIFVKNVHCGLECRNNYQVPCKLKVYLVQPKSDTNISAITYYTNSATDQVIGGAATATTKGLFPTDLTALTSQWKFKLLKDVQLEPGSSVLVSHNTGSFSYDPSLFDSHNMEYQTKFKSFGFFIRIEGVIGHDTTNASTEQTTIQAGVDCYSTTRAEIIYDAGIILDDIYINNAHTGSFTNAGVVSNRPIVDNQSYSIN